VEQIAAHPTHAQWPIAIVSATRLNEMSMWTSSWGKRKKKDPKHGCLWRWIKDNWKGFWEASIYQKRKNRCGIDCGCKSKKEQKD
jgi:hypothetical protein|tara:strand:- start:588 stop:842 length:255 start_codon:yes stop_codon:yes gene_type:complete